MAVVASGAVRLATMVRAPTRRCVCMSLRRSCRSCLRPQRGLYIYSYGPYSYGLYSYGLYSCGLYGYGLYSYGLYSYGL